MDVNIPKAVISNKKVSERLTNQLKEFHSFQHPNDLYKIDKITCYAHSYCRKPIDFQELGKLYKSAGFNNNIIDKVLNRISIGLDVLKVNKE